MVNATCSALRCSSSSRSHKHVKFHQFPHDEKRRKIWLNACKRTDVIDKEWQFFKHKYVCSLHFQKCMYSKKGRLKKFAVPSFHLSAKPLQKDSSTQTGESTQYVRPYQNIEKEQYQNNLSKLNVMQNLEKSSTTTYYAQVHVKEESDSFEPDIEMKTENDADVHEKSDMETSEEEVEIKPDVGETEILRVAQFTQSLLSVLPHTKTEELVSLKPDVEIKTENDDDVDEKSELKTSEENVEIKPDVGETEILPVAQSTQSFLSVLTHTKTEELITFDPDVEIKTEKDDDINENSDLKTSEEDVEIKLDIGEIEILSVTQSMPSLQSVVSEIIKDGETLCTQSKKRLQEIDQSKTQTIVKKTETFVSTNSIDTTGMMPILGRKDDKSNQTDRVIVLSQNPDGSVSVNPEDCMCEKNNSGEMTRTQFYRCCSKFLSASFSEIVRKQLYLDCYTKQVEKELSRGGSRVNEKVLLFSEF